MKAMNKAKGIVYAIISSSTFGMIPLFSIPLMTKAGMSETSILFYRYSLSAIGIAILCLIGKVNMRISPAAGLRIFLLSFVYAATAMALIYAYNYIPSGVVTTIHFLYPLMVVFLMAVFFKEKISPRLVLIALVALVGVGFLSLSGGGIVNTTGLLLALSTVVTYGSYIVGLNMKGIRELDGKVITFYVLVFGSVIFGSISLATTGISRVPDAMAWLNLLMLVLLPTIVSILTLVAAVKYAGSTVTSILGAFEPLVATIIGVFIFSERFTLNSLIGLALIIAAVTYVVLYNKKNETLPS